jgi:hypothetical protein
MLHIKTVKYLSGHRIWVAFDDGTDGEADLRDSLKGPVFEPLIDPGFFSKVCVDPELETIVWPNGADLAPEFVKELHNHQIKEMLLKRTLY